MCVLHLIDLRAITVLTKFDALQLSDQCYVCPEGSYSLERAVYKSSRHHTGPVVKSLDEAIASQWCNACPPGARCREGRVEPLKGYWLKPVPEKRRAEDSFLEATVLRCPADACGKRGGSLGSLQMFFRKSPQCYKCGEDDLKTVVHGCCRPLQPGS